MLRWDGGYTLPQEVDYSFKFEGKPKNYQAKVTRREGHLHTGTLYITVRVLKRRYHFKWWKFEWNIDRYSTVNPVPIVVDANLELPSNQSIIRNELQRLILPRYQADAFARKIIHHVLNPPF